MNTQDPIESLQTARLVIRMGMSALTTLRACETLTKHGTPAEAIDASLLRALLDADAL